MIIKGTMPLDVQITISFQLSFFFFFLPMWLALMKFIRTFTLNGVPHALSLTRSTRSTRSTHSTHSTHSRKGALEPPRLYMQILHRLPPPPNHPHHTLHPAPASSSSPTTTPTPSPTVPTSCVLGFGRGESGVSKGGGGAENA